VLANLCVKFQILTVLGAVIPNWSAPINVRQPLPNFTSIGDGVMCRTQHDCSPAGNRRSSAVAERPRDASCHWIFHQVTQDHSIRNDIWEGRKSLFRCRPNYVCILYGFWDIQRDLRNSVRGCWRSLKMAPFDILYTTLYWLAIVSTALSCIILVENHDFSIPPCIRRSR